MSLGQSELKKGTYFGQKPQLMSHSEVYDEEEDLTQDPVDMLA